MTCKLEIDRISEVYNEHLICQEKLKLDNLLYKEKAVFAKDTMDLGWTNRVRHNIELLNELQ